VGAAGPVIGPPCVVRHTVQAGEDVASIAAQYGADAEEIRRVNGFGALQAGQTLLVPRARP
jgi:LysM repeat protein